MYSENAINGKYQDELGLLWYDFGARNYDAQLGRWFNIDPMAEKYSSFSPYNYCLNNPENLVDPSGMTIIPIKDSNGNIIGYTVTGDGDIAKIWDPNASIAELMASCEKASESDGSGSVSSGGSDPDIYSNGLASSTSSSNSSPDQNLATIIAFGRLTIITWTGYLGEIRINSDGSVSFPNNSTAGTYIEDVVVNPTNNCTEGWSGDKLQNGLSAFSLGNTAKTGLFDFAVRTNYKSARTAREFNKLKPTQKAFRTTNTLGKGGARYLNTFKVLGKATGFATAALAINDAIQNPTTGNKIQAIVSVGLAIVRVNPIVGIGLGILDATGASDYLFDKVGEAIDNL